MIEFIKKLFRTMYDSQKESRTYDLDSLAEEMGIADLASFKQFLEYGNQENYFACSGWQGTGNQDWWLTAVAETKYKASLNNPGTDFEVYITPLVEFAKQSLFNTQYLHASRVVMQSGHSLLLDDSESKMLNSCYGFLDNLLYLCQKLPYKDKVKNMVVQKIALITSDRRCIQMDRKIVKKILGIEINKVPIVFENRWSLNSINEFLTYKSNNISLTEAYNLIRETLEKYIDFDDKRLYDFISIWIIGTYFHRLFQAYPYLFAHGAKRTGKTKLLTLIICTAFNAIPALVANPANIYRLIEEYNSTLVLDEDYRITGRKDKEMWSILLSGYKKGMKVFRGRELAGKKYIQEGFETYSPKVFANISGIEETLSDRTITVIMTRTLKRIGDTQVVMEDPIWQIIRDKLYLCLMDNWKKVSDQYKFYEDLRSGAGEEEILSDELEVETIEIPKIEKNKTSSFVLRVNARALELWKPLLTIASLISENVMESLISLAEEQEKIQVEEDILENMDAILIETLTEIVVSSAFYPIKKIADLMREKDPDHAQYITSERTGRMLKKYNLVGGKKRVGKGIEIFIDYDKLKLMAKKMGVKIKKLSQKDIISNILANAAPLIPQEDLINELMNKLDMDQQKAEQIAEELNIQGTIIKEGYNYKIL